jgi:hypothetical protein
MSSSDISTQVDLFTSYWIEHDDTSKYAIIALFHISYRVIVANSNSAQSISKEIKNLCGVLFTEELCRSIFIIPPVEDTSPFVEALQTVISAVNNIHIQSLHNLNVDMLDEFVESQ